MRNPWKAVTKKETPDSSFKTTIQKAIDGDGGSVHLFRYDSDSINGLYARLSPFDSDVKDWKERDVEAYLNQAHGGGRYRVRVDFKNKEGREVEAKSFDFVLAGEPKEGTYELKKTKQAETQQVTDIFKTAMDFAKEVKGGDGGNNALTQTLIQSLMAQISDMRKENTQLIMTLVADKQAGGNMSEMITNMMQMEEFKSMLQPKVEQNETIEMVRAVGPILGALMSRGQPQGQIQMAEALPPGQPQNQDINLGAHQLTTQATPSAKPNEASHLIPNGTAIKRDEFEVVMLDPLIDQINAGASPEEIAIMMKTIIDWSFWRVKSGIEPHAAIIGLVTALVQASQGKADMASIEKAYIEFTRIIEMPQELVDPVKSELIKIYAPFFVKAQAGGVENATVTP